MKAKFSAVIFSFAINNSAFAENTISLSELSRHNSENDCWLAIDGYVYNVSKYIILHKEECKKSNFVEYCGKDASEAWKTKEAEKVPHKKKSRRKLESAKIGKLIAM
ncbi:MAG: cytochrome b5 domain-containing protein [Oligoflexales bacterium]|nr:cytochrome b5 domain-containing protein [Oligoflexales bacterium]